MIVLSLQKLALKPYCILLECEKPSKSETRLRGDVYKLSSSELANTEKHDSVLK